MMNKVQKVILEIDGTNWTILASHEEEHQHPVYLLKNVTKLAVKYGHEFRVFALRDNLRALEEFGYCVRHAMECNGRFE